MIWESATHEASTQPSYTHVDLRSMPGACGWCSTDWQAVIHSGPCPKVKAIEYDNYGHIKRVEFREVTPFTPFAPPPQPE